MENKNKQKKEITLEDIAELIKSSSKKTEKVLVEKIETSTDELAAMTQKQFLELGQKIEKVEIDIKEIKADTDDIKANINKKVDIFIHKDLEYRVEKLEEKNRISLKRNMATA